MMLTDHAAGSGFAGYIVQSVAVLVALALLAWVLARFVGPRLRAVGGRTRLRVVERLVLEPRRTLYVVEVDGAPLLIGVSDGSVRLLKPLDGPQDAPGADGADR